MPLHAFEEMEFKIIDDTVHIISEGYSQGHMGPTMFLTMYSLPWCNWNENESARKLYKEIKGDL